MQDKPFRLIYVLLLIATMLECGCNQRGIDLNVRFERMGRLAKGCPVIFDSKAIGHVSSFAYEKTGWYLVKLSIMPEFSNALTEYSRFYIVSDPADPQKRAIEMDLLEKGGRLLKNNETIDGSDELLRGFEKIRKELEKGFHDLQKEYQKIIDNLQQLPEQEKFKVLKEALQQLLEQIQNSGAAAREKLKQEILPQLKQELEDLREALRGFDREKELEPLEDQIREIRSL